MFKRGLFAWRARDSFFAFVTVWKVQPPFDFVFCLIHHLASPPFRVNVFRNSAAKSREGGKVIVLNETTPWAEFLQKAAYKLELPHIAKKVFNSDGGEVCVKKLFNFAQIINQMNKILVI